MEVEIEKIQSAAGNADREENRIQLKQDNEQQASYAKEQSRKWKLNSRRSVMTSSLSHGHELHSVGQKHCMSRRPSARDAEEIIQFERVDHEQVAEKRQTTSQTKNDTYLAKHSGVSKNTQQSVK